MAGKDYPESGKVLVDDIDVTRLRCRELTQYRLRRVGYVFQFLNFIPILTV